MSSNPSDALVAGRQALAEGEWRLAKTLFERSLGEEETPDGHAGLAHALWWMGDLRGAMDHRESAYAMFRRDDHPADALENALFLILDYQSHVGNYAAAAGWLARAERLMEDREVDEFVGWLKLASSNQGRSPTEGEQLAREALEWAHETGDLELELCALSKLGAHLVQQGRVDEGVVFLDEAMAGSLGGDADNRDVVVFTSCNMMVSCANAAEFDRAIRWVHAADRFTDRYGCPFLYAECRAIYGGVLIATGDWDGAERELTEAIEASQDSVPEFLAQALATLASLRLAQGRSSEARQLISGIEDHPWAIPTIARFHLNADRPEAAHAVLSRQLRVAEAGRLQLGSLLELLGDAELACGRSEAASRLGDDLIERAGLTGCAVLEARGRRLLGRVGLAGDDPDARAHLETATALFGQLHMPFEAALTQVLLAQLIAQTEPQAADAELRASLAVLDGLGADADADRVSQLLRGLGAEPAVRIPKRSEGELTNREEQVFELLGEGLSNPEIADRLFVSRKTVEHHVARVLSKLGVKNRAQAAAEVVRRRAANTP